MLGIDHLVEVTVCAGETLRGNPYPDPFLEAAGQLGDISYLYSILLN